MQVGKSLGVIWKAGARQILLDFALLQCVVQQLQSLFEERMAPIVALGTAKTPVALGSLV